MKDYYDILDDWFKDFRPIQNEEGYERAFDAYSEADREDMLKITNQLSSDQGTFPYQHIWSRVDGDNGKMIILNGRHSVNFMDYFVCEIPWGDKHNHTSNADVYIETKYEE